MERFSAGDGTNTARYLCSLRGKPLCETSFFFLNVSESEVFFFFFFLVLQLGLGDVVDRNTPALVPMENYHLRNVSCGWWHTLAIADAPT